MSIYKKPEGYKRPVERPLTGQQVLLDEEKGPIHRMTGLGDWINYPERSKAFRDAVWEDLAAKNDAFVCHGCNKMVPLPDRWAGSGYCNKCVLTMTTVPEDKQ